MQSIDAFWIKVLFAAIGSLGLALYAVKALRRHSLPTPVRSARVRVRISGATYPAVFLGEREGGWALSMPDRRDLLRPIVPGEPAQVLVSVEQGVMAMQTTVRGNIGVLLIDRPRTWTVEDRREDSRMDQVAHIAAKLDGDKVVLEDISPRGARLRSRDALGLGQRVRLDVAGFSESVYGWVLACSQRGDRFVSRVRFETETDLANLARG